jgi:hypothetical protein
VTSSAWALLGTFILLLLQGCGFRREKLVQAQGSLDPSFESLQRDIFEPKCVRCHSGPDAPHGIVLSSYASITSKAIFPALIIPGHPESSSLYTAVESGDMPDEGAPLTPRELAAIRTWILQLPPDPGGTEPGCGAGEPGDCDPQPGGPAPGDGLSKP